MSNYETPELLQVGAVQQVVFGTADTLTADNPVTPQSFPMASVLDFD